MRKKIAVAIIAIAALALLPIAMYGTQVEVAKVSFSLSVGNFLAMSYGPAQIPSFVAGISNAKVDVETMNPYQYIIARNTARTQTTTENVSGEDMVDITITFELRTPSNKTLTFTIATGSDQGVGTREVITMIGPEDGVSMTGTFYLTITITIKVTLPGDDHPVVNLDLDPVIISFEIP